MLDILIFIILGLLIGVSFGLIPGIHPNMIILLIPLLASLNLDPINLITLITSIGVSNVFVDFIPSMLLGAPEPGKELLLLPAHKMLLAGNGYDAIKLVVIGGVGSLVIVLVTLPLIIFGIPQLYSVARPFTYVLLIFIVFLIVWSEKKSKLISIAAFIMAGLIGLFSASLPIDRNLLLFPIFSGLFGVSMLLLTTKTEKIKKRAKPIYVTGRQTRRSVLFGSVGGTLSGLLPGVGSSEIASLASVDKNEKSFLITIGAVTISNALLSMMAIWLIQNPRSGVAVILHQLTTVGFNEFLLIFAVSLFVGGVSAIITLKLAKGFIGIIEKIDYVKLSRLVIILIVAMTVLFTGLYGLLLLVTCTALGIFVNMSGIRRSILMGVLILPTIIFYLPIL